MKSFVLRTLHKIYLFLYEIRKLKPMTVDKFRHIKNVIKLNKIVQLHGKRVNNYFHRIQITFMMLKWVDQV